VALLAAKTGDESKAASIMLVSRVVKTLSWRQSAGVPLLLIVFVQFFVVSHCSPVCIAHETTRRKHNQKHKTRLSLGWRVSSTRAV
jgi:hypothetical protein